ncbi:DJ-1/PfpI family protein [Streptomyces sp. SID1328]|uniref:DJ-1/PfpI family protein n=1 Tax=Streptomyces sp. SID1328 TaxID=2690250 RepID=UPI001F27778A|nr:DJ-1/PfpI family protein [Streptomyces sp. SID1328]
MPALDVLLYPGGRGTRPRLNDSQHLEWVRRQRRSVPVMTSVCNGSLVFAAAGLLTGRPATTHWGALERLREFDSTIDVRPDERFGGPVPRSYAPRWRPSRGLFGLIAWCPIRTRFRRGWVDISTAWGSTWEKGSGAPLVGCADVNDQAVPSDLRLRGTCAPRRLLV